MASDSTSCSPSVTLAFTPDNGARIGSARGDERPYGGVHGEESVFTMMATPITDKEKVQRPVAVMMSRCSGVRTHRSSQMNAQSVPALPGHSESFEGTGGEASQAGLRLRPWRWGGSFTRRQIWSWRNRLPGRRADEIEKRLYAGHSNRRPDLNPMYSPNNRYDGGVRGCTIRRSLRDELRPNCKVSTPAGWGWPNANRGFRLRTAHPQLLLDFGT